MTYILGHRGAKAYYAENTLLSFENAINQGADGIELDIHYSKDGQIMVFHDFTLDRMCGVKGAIYEKTAKELKDCRVHYKNQSEEIPTLEEVLMLLTALQEKFNKKLLLNVEFKAGSDFYPNIEQRTLDLCYRYLPSSQLIFSSFDHYALKRIKEIDSEAQIGLLTTCAMVDPWEYIQKLKANFYHPNHLTLTQSKLDEYTSHQIKLNPYTVNDPNYAKLFIKNHCHAIITDTPDVMIAIRRDIEQSSSDTGIQ